MQLLTNLSQRLSQVTTISQPNLISKSLLPILTGNYMTRGKQKTFIFSASVYSYHFPFLSQNSTFQRLPYNNQLNNFTWIQITLVEAVITALPAAQRK
jgi:hypothetical protein